MDSLVTALETLFAALPGWLDGLAMLVSASAAIAALTPSRSDDAVLGALLRIINIVGLNVGRARNADDM